MRKINEVQVQFHLGAAERRIPAGRACHLQETDGAIAVLVRHGEATQSFITRMNELHRVILGAEGHWAQHWNAGTDRVDAAPKGLGIATVEWAIVPSSRMPRGVECLPLEEPGRFVWAIRAGSATPQLCAEMNTYLARITGDGLWVQHWDAA
ncbi:hypothetical protein [Streptomyces sp. NPDC051569]|uniref:hypothetical protein n=1 Tax=Streptomyces sp. NPDC051569 TaxID=3365661 RepID=UPI0037A095C5